MIGELAAHLLQSTVFAVAAGLLTLAFRANRAGVRYWIWLSASLKFFVPFALLMSVGTHMGWSPWWSHGAHRIAKQFGAQFSLPAVPTVIGQIGQGIPGASPSAQTEPGTLQWLSIVLPCAWFCGFAAIVLMRVRGWLRIRDALRVSTLADIRAGVEVRVSRGPLEPGVVGLFRPVLLLPEDVLPGPAPERLTPAQFDAILAHELCHVRRRDNLLSAIHMIAEAVFWFHPLVWWIGARLVEERERACDEQVLILGSQPRVYAEAILNVCRRCVESPLVCVSGITGFHLETRVKRILTGRIPGKVPFLKKMALSAAAIMALALPIGVGMMSGPALTAQSPSDKPLAIEAISIASCGSGNQSTGVKGRGRGGGGGPVSVVPLVIDPAGRFSAGESAPPGKVRVNCQSVEKLIEAAYVLLENDGRNFSPGIPIESDPSMGWIHTDRYEINATAPGTRMPEMAGRVLQSLLEDKFGVRVHRVAREVPAYQLTVAESGSKLQPFREGSCVRVDFDKLRATLFSAAFSGQVFEPQFQTGVNYCANRGGGDAVVIQEAEALSIGDFIRDCLGVMNRPVIDKTGLAGLFNFHLEYAPDQTTPGAGPPAVPPITRPGPTVLAAVQTQLGLKLTPSVGPREFLVIDRVERPSVN